MKVLGLMSGTSADGVDAAVVEIEGTPPHLSVKLISHSQMQYEDAVRQAIFALFQKETAGVSTISEMNFVIGELFAGAAQRAVDGASLGLTDIDLIGSAGQTVYHGVGSDAVVKSTLQIGEASVIAQRTGVTTIADFRTRDVAAGGQGAPLVSYADYLLFRHDRLTRAMQNIGGIANVTVLPAGCQASGVLAFDTGPGGMLIDFTAELATNGQWRFDQDGQLAAQGQISEVLLAELLKHPFFTQQFPKTTGREQFGVHYGQQFWKRGKDLGLRDVDLVATATALTAASIAKAYTDLIPHHIDQVILGGGSSNNPTLVGMIREQVAPSQVLRHEDLGFSSASKEAIAFAVLAYETWHNRPGNLPSCTGATESVVLGKISPGNNYAALLPRAIGLLQMTGGTWP